MRQRVSRGVLLCLLLLGIPGYLTAQAWAPDTTFRRLDWGTVNLLVGADTLCGVSLWAETSSLHYTGTKREYISSFNPTVVLPWLDRASALLSTEVPPSANSVGLETPPLIARDSSRLVLVRGRDKARWSRRVRLLFLPAHGGAPWTIRASREQMREFLKLFFSRAVRSRYVPDSARPRQNNPLEAVSEDSAMDSPPVLISRPPLDFPATLPGRPQEDEVWLQFLLRKDGTPDPDSFVALLYHDRAFVEAAVRCLSQARYSPGFMHGEPIAVVVNQHVIFRQ